MLVTEVTNDTAYFERAFMHGSCSYIIRDLHGDWYIEVSDFNALEHPGEVELDYELTDEEKYEVQYLIEQHLIEYNIIDELTDPANYYDEDEWRYTC
jgi:hypothetical protein